MAHYKEIHAKDLRKELAYLIPHNATALLFAEHNACTRLDVALVVYTSTVA